MAALIDHCEGAGDHDSAPLTWRTPRLGLDLDLGHYSRLRAPNPESSYSVLG